MKKEISGILVCMLVITTLLPITGATVIYAGNKSVKPLVETIAASDGDDPEITDEEGDTLFDYVDILWASFYENPDEPEYLYAALKISNLKDKIGCVYAIHWYFDGVHYDTAFRNGVLIPRNDYDHWSCNYYERRPIDTWNESLNSGSFDLETSIITWKVHKSCIGNPQPGDVLTHAYVFTAQRISKLGLIPFGKLFRYFGDGTSYLDSKDYIIQY